MVLTGLNTRLGAVEAWQAKVDKSRETTQEKLDSASQELRRLSLLTSPLTSCQESLRILRDQVEALTMRITNAERALTESYVAPPTPSKSTRPRLDDVVARIAAALSKAGKAPMDLFDNADLNHDGKLSHLELERILCRFQGDLTAEEIYAIFDRFDANKDGLVSAQEFCSALLNGVDGEREAGRSEDHSLASPSESYRSKASERRPAPLEGGFSVEDQTSEPELLVSRERNEAVEEQVADVCDQVDELHHRLEEQLESLHERLLDVEVRVQDTETNLQDIQLDHDVKQETTHVSEQVLRLAVRMQRLEHSSPTGASSSAEEIRELRSELGDFSEQLLHLAGRLSHAERGLSGIAEAFSRVCEEVAQLREHRSQTRSPIANSQGEVDDQAISPKSTSELEVTQRRGLGSQEADADIPLHNKVGEMERSLESMAEVVWELRKQVTALRGSFSALQNASLGEAASGSGSMAGSTMQDELNPC
jgi:predicted  nucleic acid-binding Zn-ribbon protein